MRTQCPQLDDAGKKEAMPSGPSSSVAQGRRRQRRGEKVEAAQRKRRLRRRGEEGSGAGEKDRTTARSVSRRHA
jgi:hypothetical protein